MTSDERLKAIEARLNIARRLGDDEDGPNWYLHDVEWLMEENRRLRQIIADVRRLVETMEPDNPEVRA